MTQANDPDGRLEKAIWQFEHAWQSARSIEMEQDSDSQPATPVINDFLPKDSQSDHAELLEELIGVDLEHRWKHGLNQRAEHYVELFPELLCRDGSLPVWLVQQEFEARASAGQLPTAEEIQRRFPDREKPFTQLLKQARDESRLQQASGASGDRSAPVLPMKAFDSGKMGSQLRSGAGERIDHLKPGSRIGRYVIDRLVGRGSFASVWRANDEDLGRDIAIKILRPELSVDAQAVQRMLREARAVARLEHNNIVPIYEVGHVDGCPYIVSQFIDGPDLKEYLLKNKVSLRHAAETVRDMGFGLDHAHRHRVVHRDIKPANILMYDDHRPMIADFGLAQESETGQSSMTHQGDLLGTPAYMSPEQARGDHQLVDARTDIYSLGAILYELITGRLPFEGGVSSTIHSVINDVARSARRINPSVPQDLETIVVKTMQKDPSDRYASALEFSEDLQRWLDGKPIHARPVGIPERILKWSKRRPRLAGLIATTTILVVFLLGLGIQLRNVAEQRDRAEQAETGTEKLLIQSAADAGRLALQRGHMQKAVDNFQTYFEKSTESNPELRLQYVEALMATRQTGRALSQLEGLALGQLDESTRGQMLIWQAELAMEQNAALSDAIDLLENARATTLSPGDRAYVDAMLAKTTPDAISHLKQAVAFEPLRHRSRRALVLMLLSLAQFEDAALELRVAEQVFPKDTDFALMEAIVETATNDLESGQEIVDSMELNSQQKADFVRLLKAVDFAVRGMSHDGNQKMGFDDAGLRSLLTRFVNDVFPTLAERGYHFPPHIAQRFETFDDVLRKIVVQPKPDGGVERQLRELVQVHPEGSLLVLLMGQCLSRDDFEQGQHYAKLAADRSAFVDGSDSIGLEGVIVTTGLIIIRQLSDETDSQYETFVQYAKRFEEHPGLIKKYSKGSAANLMINVAIGALQSEITDEQLVSRWLNRYAAQADTDQEDVLWIRMIIAQCTNDLLDVIRICDQLLAMDPDDKHGRPNKEIRDARATALAEVNRSVRGLQKSPDEKSDSVRPPESVIDDEQDDQKQDDN